jgi:hypothetical protein
VPGLLEHVESAAQAQGQDLHLLELPVADAVAGSRESADRPDQLHGGRAARGGRNRNHPHGLESRDSARDEFHPPRVRNRRTGRERALPGDSLSGQRVPGRLHHGADPIEVQRGHNPGGTARAHDVVRHSERAGSAGRKASRRPGNRAVARAPAADLLPALGTPEPGARWQGVLDPTTSNSSATPPSAPSKFRASSPAG